MNILYPKNIGGYHMKGTFEAKTEIELENVLRSLMFVLNIVFRGPYKSMGILYLIKDSPPKAGSFTYHAQKGAKVEF